VLNGASSVQSITMVLQGGAMISSVTCHNWISGVYTGEVDRIVMRAFDTGDNLQGSITGTTEFMTLDFAEITKVTWDDVGNSGFVVDEIVLNGTSNVVPESSTNLLLASGLAIQPGVARRCQKS